MNATSQVMVTLSADLLKQLRKESREQKVSLRWLVAGLVCDTLETGRQLQDAGQPAATSGSASGRAGQRGDPRFQCRSS